MTPTKLTDPVWQFEISGIGWIDLKLNNGFQLSHSNEYGDQFGQLLDALLVVSGVNRHFSFHGPKAEKTTVSEQKNVIWQDENTSFDIELRRLSSEMLAVTVTEFFAWDDKTRVNPTLRYEQQVPVENLLRDTLSSLFDLLEAYGLIGFKTHWKVADFPVAAFIQLKCSSDVESMEKSMLNRTSMHGWRCSDVKEEVRYLYS